MINLNKILFIDIETVPGESSYQKLTQGMQKEWDRKAKSLRNWDKDADPALPPSSASLFEERGGIFAEFGKVVCIGIGTIYEKSGIQHIYLKSITGNDEKALLEEFLAAIAGFESRQGEIIFCGHNIKEFDMPYLCRRMMINALTLPRCMELSGKKPWEVTHIDTLEMWKYGDYKNFTSLSLLAQVLGIPSPKDDLDGSMVASVYWNDNNLPRIAQYCLQDVHTTAKVFLALAGYRHLTLNALYANNNA
ncbi:MAG: 3'-5' exonuclease [Chitinophagia bacterium]|nr:3'-5' exonuclease [Chitinophagia bacterium]